MLLRSSNNKFGYAVFKTNMFLNYNIISKKKWKDSYNIKQLLEGKSGFSLSVRVQKVALLSMILFYRSQGIFNDQF